MGAALGGMGGAGGGKGGGQSEGAPIGDANKAYKERVKTLGIQDDPSQDPMVDAMLEGGDYGIGGQHSPINRAIPSERGDMKSQLESLLSPLRGETDEEEDEETKSWRDRLFPEREDGGSRDPLKRKLDSLFGGEKGRFGDGQYEKRNN